MSTAMEGDAGVAHGSDVTASAARGGATRWLATALLYAALVTLAVLTLLPLLWMVSASL